MAVTTGTVQRVRKRRIDSSENGLKNQNTTNDIAISPDLQALFQKHFEAQFEPLPEGILSLPTSLKDTEQAEEDSNNYDLGSTWEGLSDEDKPAPKLIQHDTSETTIPRMTKEEYKTFMTSKPPSTAKSPVSRKGNPHLDDPDASTDAANLKKDLALQRLLKESHLLSPSDFSSNLSHSGVNRHRALDMRLQDMGSKSSIFKQDKMPLAQRKGIITKAKMQEDNKRKEAFENGIILEKAKARKRNNGMRERGVGAPAVGRFQGGTLKLSTKDIAEIEGPRKGLKGGKGGKRKR